MLGTASSGNERRAPMLADGTTRYTLDKCCSYRRKCWWCWVVRSMRVKEERRGRERRRRFAHAVDDGACAEVPV
jgi:hypothetical protein